MEHSWINADLRLSEIPDRGIKVEQNGRSYIARKQTLNSRTIAIFEMCVELLQEGTIAKLKDGTVFDKGHEF